MLHRHLIGDLVKHHLRGRPTIKRAKCPSTFSKKHHSGSVSWTMRPISGHRWRGASALRLFRLIACFPAIFRQFPPNTTYSHKFQNPVSNYSWKIVPGVMQRRSRGLTAMMRGNKTAIPKQGIVQ